MSPSRVSNGSVASRAGTPAAISSLAVRTAVRESTSSASQSERPARTPPSTSSVSSTALVFGVKRRSRLIVTTSAPQRKPLLHAPGGAYSCVTRSEMSSPTSSIVFPSARSD
jgi:hypothetical protein